MPAGSTRSVSTRAPPAAQAPAAPQVEVLELQNAVFCNCTRYLNSALATCSRLHTLVATGLWPLDLAVLGQAPRLECLAINICRGASLLPLAQLPQLRCRLNPHTWVGLRASGNRGGWTLGGHVCLSLRFWPCPGWPSASCTGCDRGRFTRQR